MSEQLTTPKAPRLVEDIHSAEIFVPTITTDNSLAGDVEYWGRRALDEPLLQGLGVRSETAADGSRLVMPSLFSMTDLAHRMGHGDRKFVSAEQGHIEGPEYLEYFAKGEIPVSSEPFYRMHDQLGHGIPFLAMPRRAFGVIKQLAAEAIDSRDEERIKQLTSDIDFFSAGVATASVLREIYGRTMNKTTAAILAKKDMIEVRKALKAIEADKPKTPREIDPDLALLGGSRIF